ncbi:MAG: peptidoglycan-binding protein [Bacilli bacterium]
MAIRSPIIPTDIVVHLGPPNAAAKNITVPFIEYIKNVASSEIYPNWPTDAIKANVLAQISFALNRIYNEWYPSQGYDFDITSSPVYDQAFNENQQFFDNISKIVDDIFNNYIVKDNQIQPLFATYCDGKNTTCEGLSQWGTVDLAKAGKDPLQILKTYYGNDIKLVYNAPVDANVPSYPGFPLKLGEAGGFIKILKSQLNRIGQNYPAIPIITNDNIVFDVETERAVKKFQNIFDLDETGIVDKATWYKIKYIYNAVKKISDLYSEGIKAEEVDILYDNQVKLGDSGNYITTINYYLNLITYFDSDLPFLDLRSKEFTDKTEQVVKAFQNKYNLPVTGIIDVETWKVIKEVYEKTLNMIPNEYLEYIDEFFPGRFLVRGMEGNDVVRLQSFLYKICEATHEIPGVKVNGVFDYLTEQSVKYIQNKYDLTVDGIVYPATWYYIVELSKGSID